MFNTYVLVVVRCDNLAFADRFPASCRRNDAADIRCCATYRFVHLIELQKYVFVVEASFNVFSLVLYSVSQKINPPKTLVIFSLVVNLCN